MGIYMPDQGVAHQPNHRTGLKDPAVVVVEMDRTTRAPARWFKRPHNNRTQAPRALR